MAKAAVKKRGVKPGTKRGSYKKFMTSNEPPKFNGPMTLCGQAEDAISNLEARLSNIIRRINSIMN